MKEDSIRYPNLKLFLLSLVGGVVNSWPGVGADFSEALAYSFGSAVSMFLFAAILNRFLGFKVGALLVLVFALAPHLLPLLEH